MGYKIQFEATVIVGGQPINMEISAYDIDEARSIAYEKAMDLDQAVSNPNPIGYWEVAYVATKFNG